MRGVAPTVALVLMVVTTGACGSQSPSSSSTPTAPTPTPSPPGGSVTLVTVSGTSPRIGATSPFAATANLSDGTTVDVTTQATWESSNQNVVTVSSSGVVAGLGVGDSELSATYRGTRGTRRVSLEAPPLTAFQRDYVEALFLGTGRLTPTDGNHACSATGVMRGFPRGTSVSVIVSSSVSSDQLAAIRRVSDQILDATGGVLRTAVTVTNDLDPRPSANEVTSTARTDAASQGCPSDNGCTIHVFAGPGVFTSSRAVQPPTQTPAAFGHDVIGHGALGLCHPDGNLIGGAGLSLMSAGPNVFSGGAMGIADRLTSLDLLAARTVYDAGLGAGARRTDFLRVGLINP